MPRRTFKWKRARFGFRDMDPPIRPPRPALGGSSDEPPDRPDPPPTLRPSRIRLAFSGRAPENRAAMSLLYETYREPVRNYIRRWFHRPQPEERIDELVQKFFMLRIEKLDLVTNWDPERTRFPDWLFSAVRHFLLNEIRPLHEPVSLEAVPEPPHHETPDLYFIRDCARALLRRALDRLRVEYDQNGKADLHRLLVPFLPKPIHQHERAPYSELARELQKLEATLRVDMHRLRRDWKRILLDEIEQSVGTSDVQAELELMLRSFEVREWE